jgi:uncharacterized protein with PQ loop repeat
MTKNKTINENKRIDRLTTIIGLGMPLVSVPQLYAALTTNDIQSISLITWAYFTFQAGVFAIFSIKHKQKPLILTYIPLFIIQLGIVVTILIRSI